ncbi:hypothetical protein DZ978_002485 [Pseudomonas aeruginosa]|uniref:hypothetical protein n=1 Tax=Pseudomonas aeruginosa TaxID=287 RepID=UPI000E31A07F|nr:hypothetical protein [Pseudomonas aeruginosa]NPX87779.1 hypothetical protein [Pseudomonas aeruginosa]
MQHAKQPEQAEAERPEVVAYFDRNYPSTGDAFIWSNYEGSPYEPVMTVAQHDRIVGALRADRDSWAEQAEQRLADWDEMCKERDAALAEVKALRAELQSQRERNTELIFKLGSATNGWGRCEKERDAVLAERDALATEAQALREEVAALRAMVVVVPERKLLNAGVPGLNRNSGWNACLDELARLNGMTVSESALDTLRRFATGNVKHMNNGLCPDCLEGHEARDPDCPVCRALLDTESDNV